MNLVIDVGTTGLRAAIVRADATIAASEYRPFAPESPFPGLVEFDATRMAELVVETAEAVVAARGNPTIGGVGVATQRASTLLWDRSTGVPLGPALGWLCLATTWQSAQPSLCLC